jgi:ABC-2 type transport system permease protein
MFKVTKRVLLGISNDKRLLVFLLVVPVLVMLVFGTTFTGQVRHATLIIIDHDQGVQFKTQGALNFSDLVIQNLRGDQLFNLRYSNNLTGALDLLSRGGAYGVLFFPSNFSQSAVQFLQNKNLTGETSAVLWLDRATPSVTEPMWDGVTSAIEQALCTIGFCIPSSVEMIPVNGPYGAMEAFKEYYVSGIVAFAIFILSSLLSLVSFPRERMINTLERLRATPIRDSEIVVGNMLAYGVLGIVQSVVLFSVAVFLFGFSVKGSMLLALIVVVLLAMVSAEIGITLSALAKNEVQAVQFIPVLVLASFILSGIFWPLQALPGWLRPVSYLLPLTYAAHALRMVMVEGFGIWQIVINLLIQCMFALAFFATSVLALKSR